MEADPEIEFEHFLAAKLSMTVAQMRHEMSNDEFQHWHVFYARQNQQQELEMAKAR